jgi:hypothetical protein
VISAAVVELSAHCERHRENFAFRASIVHARRTCARLCARSGRTAAPALLGSISLSSAIAIALAPRSASRAC